MPESYEDLTGLPFQRKDLTQKEVDGIFGPHLPADQANLLLRILHGRRIAGTLEDPSLVDPSLHVNREAYRRDDQAKALEWLRHNVPVDEVLNAGLRAEEELQWIEQQQQQQQQQQEEEAQEQEQEQEQRERGQEAGDTEAAHGQHTGTSPKDASRTQGRKVEAPTELLPFKPRRPSSDSPYGEGVFDRIRARNVAIRQAEEKRLEEERARDEQERAQWNVGTLQTDQARPRQISPWVQKHIARATSDLTAPPEMAAWRRLLPSYAVAVLIVGACALFAWTYRPPKKSERIWPHVPPAAATVIGLIAANVSVWLMWRLFPPAFALLNKYFLVVAATPRPLQLVGAMFSHHQFWRHLAPNMLMLWLFGVRLHDEVGRGNFLALYLASGTVGFLASLTHLVLFRGLQYTTHGASGAVYGVMTAFLWTYRFDEFKILGLPPDPTQGPQGLVILAFLLALQIGGMVGRYRVTMDVPSHLGGMAAGLLGIRMLQKPTDGRAHRRRPDKPKTPKGDGSEKTADAKESPEKPETSGPVRR